ncbi:MAG: diguanylate cyclase response regulator [Candidatus Dadabacteria bacterium]
MKILIVDDSPDSQLLIKSILNYAGYKDLLTANSALEAFRQLGMDNLASASTDIDLILMDVVMPEMDGIEACRLIKSFEYLRDIPIIIVTATAKDLQMAFAAGATDYITKPLNKVELLARVSSALRLKREIDNRKAREQELMKLTQQLEELNQILQRLSSSDGLTGVANRRHFDLVLKQEWRRAIRDATPLSLILIDVDFFKAYNDTYGHQMGDDCLKRVANSLKGVLKRPTDLIARYGGEEFVALLPKTDTDGAAALAEGMRAGIEALGIAHARSQVTDRVTISLGVATVVPNRDSSFADLVAEADHALYQAKQEGRNRVKSSSSIVMQDKSLVNEATLCKLSN